MSGVFGVIRRKADAPNRELLASMAKALAHRPWYHIDTFYDQKAPVGLGRVGIGIFNREPQPAANEDHSLLGFMAGEFYNGASIRRELGARGYQVDAASDAEVVLRLYQERGTDFATALDGIFIVAVWDRTRKQLLIANDRFGLKPLYYSHHSNTFIFAPEIKAILCDPAIPRKLNLTAVAEYLRFQQMLGDKTFFEDITLLSPATVLCFDYESSSLTHQTYWDWRSLSAQPTRLGEHEVVEESERLLRGAVNKRLERAEQPGMYLSGGLDSRAMLAVLDPRYRPITTITYGYRNSRDVHLAGKIAQVTKTNHHFFEFKDGNWVKDVVDFHLDLVEGANSWIHAHGMSVLPYARHLIDVNLSGFGGGTVMGAAFEKPFIAHAPDEEAFINGMFHLYTHDHTWPGLTEAETYGLYTERARGVLQNRARESLQIELRRFEHPDNDLRSLFFNIFNHDRRFIYNFIIFNNSHFENRCPFYDYQLVEWFARLSMKHKAKKSIQCAIIDRVAPRLALIPYDKDYRLPTTNQLVRDIHAVGMKILDRIGQRFALGHAQPTLYADYENYLRNELRTWAEAILFDERTLARGIFRPEALRSLMARHLAGHEQWTIGKLAPIMTLEMTLRRFFDASPHVYTALESDLEKLNGCHYDYNYQL